MSRRINPYKLFHGSFIPEWLEERPIKEISIGAKLIYARLTRYAGKYGDCFPALEKISESTGISVSQVQRYIKELKELKLIESSRLGKKCSNRYFFLEHPWMMEAMYFAAGNSDRSDMTTHSKSDRSDMTTPMDRSDMTTPQKENQERESHICEVASQPSRKCLKNEQIKEVFEFWKKTVNKPKAVLDSKRETAIRNRLKAHSVEEIKKAIIGSTISPHHSGQNKQNKKYQDIELICRNETSFEQFLDWSEKGTQQKSIYDL